jgi:hypothetical protein
MGVHSVHIRGAFLFNSFEARVSHVYHRRWLWVAAFAFADQVCSVERMRYPPKESFDLFISFSETIHSLPLIDMSINGQFGRYRLITTPSNRA